MNTLSLSLATLLVAGATIGPVAAQPFGEFRGGFPGPPEFVGPEWRDYRSYPWHAPLIARGWAYQPENWQPEWGWRYKRVPATVAPRAVPAVTPAIPVFDPGPLLGAAVPPPIIVLPLPNIVAEAGAPLVIPTPLESALPITSPVVADAVIPARWRVAGFITAAYVTPRPVVRRAVRRVPIVRYEVSPPPYVVFATPPPYAEPPIWRHHWRPGWYGRW